MAPTTADADARLESRIDSTIRDMMAERHVPGALFTMVRGDSIVFLKGYGVANLETEDPVDPRTTIFRVASISKTVSAIAVMQMVDRGIINLDDPVNQYLTHFKLPDRFGIPTTFAHLLTHASGYDQSGPGRRTLDPAKMEPMVTYFPRAMPKQIVAPGTIISYSTWMGSIPGYMAEEISGVPFNDYMVANVFAPLEMTRSGFVRDKLPVQDIAQGYFFRDGHYAPAPFEYTKTVPGTMLMTTAEDMAHLLIMHLNQGRYRDRAILSPESIEAMHTLQVSADPRMLGATYGLYDMWANGRRILTHSGGFDGFMAQLYIIPETGTAFFMAFNQRNGGAAVNAAVQDIVFDAVIPTGVETPTAEAPAIHLPLERFTGTYQSTSFALANVDKLSAMDGKGTWKVSRGAGDTLVAFGYPYVAIEPLLFRSTEDATSYLKFYENADRDITHATFGGLLSTHRKLHWYENAEFNQAWLAATMLMFAAVLLTSLGRLLKDRLSTPGAATSALRRFPWKWLTLISLLYGVAVMGMVVGPQPSRYGLPIPFVVMHTILNVAAILSLLLAYLTFRVWRERQGRPVYRYVYAACSVGTLAFVLFLMNWNLLGFRY